MTVTGVAAGAITATVLLILGSPLLYRGLEHRRRFRRFRDLRVNTPATAAPGETALVIGTARAVEGSIEGPVSGRSATLATWDIHSLRRFHVLGVRWVWAPEALGLDTRGFELHGEGGRLAIPDWSRRDRIEGRGRLQLSGTGQMPVSGLDFDDLWIELDEFETDTRVLPNEELPAPLRQLSDRIGFPANMPSRLLPTLPRVRTPADTLRYREWTVGAGQTITVLGTVQEPSTPGGSPRLSEPEEYPALISSLEPDALIRRYRWSYWKWVYGLLLVVLVVAIVIGIGVAA